METGRRGRHSSRPPHFLPIHPLPRGANAPAVRGYDCNFLFFHAIIVFLLFHGRASDRIGPGSAQSHGSGLPEIGIFLAAYRGMEPGRCRLSRWIAVFSLLLTVVPPIVCAAVDRSAGGAAAAVTRIDRVEAAASGRDAAVTIFGDGAIFRYRTARIAAPDGVQIDILHLPAQRPAVDFPVAEAGISEVKVRYLKDRIQALVLFEEPLSRDFSSIAVGQKLIFIFQRRQDRAPLAAPEPIAPLPPAAAPEKRAQAPPEPAGQLPRSLREQLSDAPSQSSLVSAAAEGGGKEAALFHRSLDDFLRGRRAAAASGFQKAIEEFPEGLFTERALFLRAQAEARGLPPEGGAGAWRGVIRRYEEAVRRFPASRYVPLAYLGIADLYAANGCTPEAAGYYQMAIGAGSDALIEGYALLQKARILAARDLAEEALADLQTAVERLAPRHDAGEVALEMAKIHYRQGRFDKAADLLDRLTAANPAVMDRFADASLFLGHAKGQLGDHEAAAGHYLRYYNCFPDIDDKDLMLARIGDAYREAGHPHHASKIYNLTIQRYPSSEGAAIGRIRLGEYQEAPRSDESGSRPVPHLIFGQSAGGAAQMYADIGVGADEGAALDPLSRLARLKLAVLHHKKGRPRESLAILSRLSGESLPPDFAEKAAHVRDRVLPGYLQQLMRKEAHAQIVDFYYREPALFSGVAVPEGLLPAARSLAALNFPEQAAALYRRIDRLMPEPDKPPDLLYAVGRAELASGRLDEAKDLFDRLIKRYPEEAAAPEAYLALGTIYRRRQDFDRADAMYAKALSTDPSPSVKHAVLLARTEASIAAGDMNRARRSADLLASASAQAAADPAVEDRLGDVFFDLDRYDASLQHFIRALEQNADAAARPWLTFKIGRCYRRLHNPGRALEKFQEVADAADPIWSPLAAEMLADMRFNGEL